MIGLPAAGAAVLLISVSCVPRVGREIQRQAQGQAGITMKPWVASGVPFA